MPVLNRKLGRAIFRVVIITFLATLTSFAVSLLLGILTFALINLVRGGGVNMAFAYRHFAFPAAMGMMAIAFVSALTLEIRQARRARTPGTMTRAA